MVAVTGRVRRTHSQGNHSAGTGLHDNAVLYGSKLDNRAIVTCSVPVQVGLCPGSFAEQVLGARKPQSRSRGQATIGPNGATLRKKKSRCGGPILRDPRARLSLGRQSCSVHPRNSGNRMLSH